MALAIAFTDPGQASLRELDIFVQQRIKRILKRIAKTPSLGDPLEGEVRGYAKCDSGNYRAVYSIIDGRLVVFFTGHRSNVYDRMIESLRRSVEDGKKSES